MTRKKSLDQYYALLDDSKKAVDDAHAAYAIAQKKEKDRDTATDLHAYKKVHAEYEKALDKAALLFEDARKVVDELKPFI